METLVTVGYWGVIAIGVADVTALVACLIYWFVADGGCD
jgi:hypothetical protein